MQEYKTEDIRNVVLIGHTGVGKTMLMENALYLTGFIDKCGSIDAGTTVGDFLEEEKKRKISIQSSIASCEYKNKKINFIDTPGGSDFIGDVRAALRVADGAVVVVNGVDGVEIGTENIWKVADEYHVPRLVFINQMDKHNANFDGVVKTLNSKFHKPCVPVQIPIKVGDNFNGVIDLIDMKAVYLDDSGKGVRVEEIPVEFVDLANKHRENLRDVAADTDDELIEKVLEGKKLNHDEIIKGLKNAILDYKIIPITCGSLEKGIGIHLLLDLIEDSFPSPIYLGEYEGVNPTTGEKAVRHPDNKEPFSAFIFKSYSDQYAGSVSLMRIRSGQLNKDDEIVIAGKDKKIKASHLYALEGKTQLEITHASTGDVVALLKVNSLYAGDTLCDKNSQFKAHSLKLPNPVYFVAVKAKNPKEEEKLNEILHQFSKENPSFNVRFDGETHENVIESMGVRQVDIILSMVKNRTKIESETSEPKIAYRETICKPGKGHHKHKKQSGGHGQYGEVYIDVAPLTNGEEFEFINKIVGGAVPKNYIPGIEKGLREAMTSGVLGQYPMTGIQVTLYDGTFHDVDSSEMAFKIAARAALKDAVAQSSPVLLEPVMDLKIMIDDEMMGDVLSDLNSRRGRVQGMGGESEGDSSKVVNAQVPLSELLRYSIDLKSLTSGKASFDMKFSHYDKISGRKADDIISLRKKELEEME